MCGITGYWARRGDPSPWVRDLGAAVASLRARGPDDSGVWVRPGGRVGLGHTRLSILDLSPLGHQPMRSADGELTMVFNGEVYNFAAIRAELESLGHRFRSSGDSEVVLAAIAQWGVQAAVERFIGMFALAIWNEREHRLLLLRDRMGVKPLYYAWDGQHFWFGSELKALRACGAWRPEIDRDALGEYLQFGYVSAPRSIYRRVHKLLPGHWLELGEVGEPVAHRYWAPTAGEPLEGTEEELERRLEHLLVDACRYRMVSDVPVGVFLSGGIDSSSVAALVQRYGVGEVRTFTIGFGDPRFDEAGHARAVAGHLGTRHTEQVVTAADMREVLTGWADLFDEPFGDSSGVPTYLVSRLARRDVKVALSADGGDELFSGYDHYRLILERERALSRLPSTARRIFSRSLGAAPLHAVGEHLPLPGRMRHATRRQVLDRLEKLRVALPRADRRTLHDLAMTAWMPSEIAALLGGYTPGRAAPESRGRCAADEMSLEDMRHFLPDDILAKVDRTTMATGLEGREPLLDHRLVEFALRLPPHLRRGALGPKHLLRRILYRHVPREILERPKQGFAVPLSAWMRGELAPLVHEYLAPHRIRESGLLDEAQVARAVRNFMDGGPANDRVDTVKVWYLLAFEMWRSRWMGEGKRTEGVRHARAVCH